MENSREAILRAAMGLFGQKGYAGTSTREICEAAGITKPVLYYYFRDKEHLYRELMIETFNFSRQNLMHASRPRGSLRERLIRVLNEEFRCARENPEQIRFLLRMTFSPEEMLPRFDHIREFEKERGLIAEVMAEGIRAGEIQGDAVKLASVLMGMETFAVLEHFFTGRAVLTRRNAVSLVDTLLDGCRVK
jgi:TetR/AcrR family transcriptional regulator